MYGPRVQPNPYRTFHAYDPDGIAIQWSYDWPREDQAGSGKRKTRRALARSGSQGGPCRIACSRSLAARPTSIDMLHSIRTS